VDMALCGAHQRHSEKWNALEQIEGPTFLNLIPIFLCLYRKRIVHKNGNEKRKQQYLRGAKIKLFGGEFVKVLLWDSRKLETKTMT
jgi:hypothetical protein